ncbi:MAG TPA: M28 family peptidase [Spirochaetales bacterium]|nr:M28 family peptidase [Spirochaetales bacterium]
MHTDRAKAAHAFMSGIIERHGPRLPGSEAGHKAAEELRAAAAEAADEAGAQEFSLSPGAFFGYMKAMIAAYALAALLLAPAPWLSFVLMAFGAAALVLEFFLYHEFLDPAFPKARGVNVWATLEPSGPVERQLIVSGHHDSAPIFNFFVDRPELYSRRVYGAMGAYAAFLVGSLVVAIAAPSVVVRAVVAAAFALGFILVAPLWRFVAKEGTPGAGDNLAASVAAVEILREFRARRDAGKGLKGTRVVFASFDAEEAGLRGARAWAKARLPADVPTYAYNMDCVYTVDEARFLSTDINGSVTMSAPLASACSSIASELGVTVPVMPIAFLAGGTDAAELSRRGAKATTLIAMPWSNDNRSPSYHTPADLPSAVSLPALELAIDVGVSLAERLDSGELRV